jgi:hypothetical protein
MALDQAGMRVIYIAPNHEIIEENVDHSTFRNYSFLHLRGREKCCVVPEYKKLAKQGLDISSLCDDCAFCDGPCEYKSNYETAYRERPNIGLCHAHINTFLPRFLQTEITPGKLIRDEYDAIIIDENPIGVFMQQKQATTDKLLYLIEVGQACNLEPTILEILNEFLRPTLDYDRIRRIRLLNLKEVEVTKRYTKRLAEKMRDGTIQTVPIDLINFLFRMWENMTEDNIEHMIYKQNDKLNLNYFNSNPLDLGVKIIGLDGTASKIVWDHMLHTSLVEGDTLYRIDNTYCYDKANNCYSLAYQCGGARYPISSWRRSKETAVHLCKLFDKIAALDKSGKVLIVGTYYINSLINKYLKAKNVQFAKYYNLRSFNKYYKECDTVIIACEPNIPPDKMETCMALSGWDYETWHRIYTEEEMLQAIGRLRANIQVTPNGRQRSLPLKVFIFPSTGVKGYCPVCNKYYDRGTVRCSCGKLLVNTPTLLPEARLITNSKIQEMDIFGNIIDDDQLLRQRILSACPTNPFTFYNGDVSRRKLQNRFNIMVEEGLIEHVKGGLYQLTRKGFDSLPQAEKEARQGGIQKCG